ncbi:MAG TPA: hypothetical protein PKA95_18935, partial [Thermomicrobiales bacterium]|nr:hypothetical protein [Thermomicrobiales bacterium]
MATTRRISNQPVTSRSTMPPSTSQPAGVANSGRIDAGSSATQSNGYPTPSQSLFTDQGSGSTISPGAAQPSTTTTRHHTRSSSSR